MAAQAMTDAADAGTVTAELVPYSASRYGRDVVDGWAGQLAHVVELVKWIGDAELIPEALRGRPAAIAAVILAGREMGIGPMTALQHVHLIQGRPALSAHLMRALVQSAGHSVEYVAVTSERCSVRGRRHGSETWTEFAYTLDDARRAGLLEGRRGDAWRKMPREMLVARATAGICRLIGADVLTGMPYAVEELDGAGPTTGYYPTPGPPPETTGGAPATDSGPGPNTVRRATPVRKAAKEPSKRAVAEPVAPTGPPPPLPGDEPVAAVPEPEPFPDELPDDYSAKPAKADAGEVSGTDPTGVVGAESGSTPPDATSPASYPTEAEAVEELRTRLGAVPIAEPEPPKPKIPANPDAPLTKLQLARLHVGLEDLGLHGTRDDYVADTAKLTGRAIRSTGDLTRAEASRAIETLKWLASQPDPTSAARQFLDAIDPPEPEP